MTPSEAAHPRTVFSAEEKELREREQSQLGGRGKGVEKFSRDGDGDGDGGDRSISRRQRTTVNVKGPKWPLTFLGVRWGEGMWNDVKRRIPYYWSDWTDAWNYRIIPSTVYMYFANLLPALAFSFDMFESTGMSYGVNEVLLSSFLGASVFAFFAVQPLVIVGVTGPITVFNYTVYDIIAHRGTPYLPFMAWICLWSMVMHFLLGLANSSKAVRWVTRFSCDIFGFYVAFIYLQKGIQILTLQWHSEEHPDASAHLSISISLLVLMIGYLCGVIGRSNLFIQPVRTFLRDYGTPLTVIFFSGYQFIGKMKGVELLRLPTAEAFKPTLEREWLVRFWDIDTADIFLAVPFALLLTCLFYFDHNVSSLIAQGTEFPLRKPAGFHWDIFLLGVTTGIAGILGLPAPNGLIPQAPFHTESLCVTVKSTTLRSATTTSTTGDSVESKKEAEQPKAIDVTTHVVEQRFSNLAQGLLILATMSKPILHVLGLIPQGVLAGLFFVMGIQALESNGITLKLVYLFQDQQLTPETHALKKCRLKAVWWFVGLEIVGFAATFAITQTIAAVGFPVVVIALIPVRMYILPKIFRKGELRRLDQATASKFTLESVGGAWGGSGEEDDDDKEEEDAERSRSMGDLESGGNRPSSNSHSLATSSTSSSATSVSSQSLTIQPQGQTSYPRVSTSSTRVNL